MKKSFYDVLWQLCRTQGLLGQWIQEGLLVNSDNKFFWHPDVLTRIGEPDTKIVGQLKEEAGNPTLVLSRGKKKTFEDIPWLAEYNSKFSKEKIGHAGRRSDYTSTLEKMTRFTETYDYTSEEILAATDNYIADCIRDKKTEYIRKSGYFIFKIEHSTEISDLAQWCQDYRDLGSKPLYTSRTSL